MLQITLPQMWHYPKREIYPLIESHCIKGLFFYETRQKIFSLPLAVEAVLGCRANSNFIILKNVTEIAKNSMNFGGRLSREFAIFGKFFLHKFTKCITLRSILVNDLSLASVRIPLINICLIFKVIGNWLF